MVTLKQIAASLDLSVMAVSKALRDAPDIGAATKERVRKEAKRVGYVPNHLARSLRGGATQILGVIFPALNDPFGSMILSGLEMEAAARDYQILVASSQNNSDMEIRALYKMLERKVEAVFVFPLVRLQHRSPLLDVTAHHGIPLIFLHQYPADVAQYEKAGWVVDDAQKGCETITRHLLEAGHKQILYFSGPVTASSSAEHMSGFRRALVSAGLTLSDEAVFLAGFDIEGGKQAMVRALAEQVPFTAIVCVNDAVAIGAVEILRQHSYRVPQDVSVVGYGDGLLAANGPVPLTTIRQPQADLGKAAFHLWHQWKQGQEQLRGKVLPVELIVRQSSGVVKS
jgi:DNA-binding LacI/PurR family transcriptional regulator